MNRIFVNEPERDFSNPKVKENMEKAIAAVELELGKDYPLVIGGEKIFTEKKTTSINPCKKDQVIGYASNASKELADKAIRVAYDTYEEWRLVPTRVKYDYIMRLIGVLQKRRYEIAAWMILETGKNFGEADGEICEAIDFFNAYAQGAVYLEEHPVPLVESTVENNRSEYRPIGVGLVIPPWNFPFSIMAGMVISAVVTGNTVCIKPASDAPITTCKFVEMCEEAGIPAGVINLIPGSGSEIGDFVVDHPLTRFINFTGSKAVGLRIAERAAKVNEGQKWIKRIIAEMGGKNAIVVDSSADLRWAAKQAAAAAFTFQGQKCSACSRAIVLSDVYDEFLTYFKEEAESYQQGAGKDNMDICAVINKASFDKIASMIEQGKSEGRLITGGTYDDSVGFYVKPTIIADVDPKTSVIANQEIFGPVVAVMKVDTFEDAIDLANATEYGLTGSVFSANRENIEYAKDNFFVGNLYINRKCTGAVVYNHPFGGYNMSGTTAKTGTVDYLYNFVQLKSISENIVY
ncbi:MAG: L-glutamate gamma-semialdehyde dehydrogenase [Clostridia bacterium]|nr:L-glutamate gamma-semialdehyde dehydrogenase [Clostridia bacterium]